MLQSLLTKAPLIAVLGAIILFIIVAGAGMGLEWPLLAAMAAGLFAAAEAWLLWIAVRQKGQGDKHLRHIRFIADRFQALVHSAPGGYCLFTPQGMLREEYGVSARLGVESLSHMDDLIAAVKEGPELLAVFRKMQMTGETFEMEIHAAKHDRAIPVAGSRFRIGKEGPHVDVLWFCDKAAAAKRTPLKAAAESIAVPAAQTPAKEANLLSACAAVFDLFSFPVWARTPELRLIFCNKAYAKAVALPVAEVLKDQHEIAPQAAKGGGRALAEAALKNGAPQTAREHVVVNGKRRYLEATEIPLPEDMRTGEASSFALLGFAVDVTAEEEKDIELRRHLVAHHEVLEHLGAAISVYGPDKRLEFYNRAYVQLWEVEEAFLDAKPSFGEVLEKLRALRKIPEQADFRKYKKDNEAFFTSQIEPREDVMYLPDGRTLRVLIAPHPLGGLMFVHENVSDQIALETSYNTLMAVQRETIDNLAEGIAVFGPDGKLRLANTALVKLWGLSEDAIKNEPHVADLIELSKPLLKVAKDWNGTKEEMVRYALDRTPHAGRIERTDRLVIEYLTVPLPDGSVLNSYLDVTDSVRVEQALRASNAALAAADRLKSDFVANMSYQLRTPLNTITGFAEILAEQYFGKLNERQLEYTTTIKAESDKLSRIINDVLDLATIEAGRMTLDRQEVDIAALLNHAKQMTAEWARQQSLSILIECPSDIGTFEVDEQRVKQILFNLISNAINYTPAGGHIAIAAFKQDPWIVVSVLDTGVGIPEEDKERVFGKFEKTNSHLRQGGAGLGLSLVKSFVELHGGRVEIFSDEKDGTRVSCFLPQKAQASQDEA